MLIGFIFHTPELQMKRKRWPLTSQKTVFYKTVNGYGIHSITPFTGCSARQRMKSGIVLTPSRSTA